ncbi:hypothetical protein [Shewanella algae]|uniref:hypothetical protein n=1 Tax=Shewanella algae TaxID=38313 RepID=UPI001C823EC5|nr:hypothetical protein [Shewanella algae]
MLTETPGPHYLAKSVTDNDAHICAKTVAVNHMDSEKAINFNDSIVSQSHVGSNSLFTAFSLDKQMEFSTLSTTALPCLSGYPQKLWISLFETRLSFWKRCFLQPLQSKPKSKNQNKITLNTNRYKYKKKAINSNPINRALFNQRVIRTDLGQYHKTLFTPHGQKLGLKVQNGAKTRLTLTIFCFIEAKNTQLSQNAVDKFVGNTGEIGE